MAADSWAGPVMKSQLLSGGAGQPGLNPLTTSTGFVTGEEEGRWMGEAPRRGRERTVEWGSSLGPAASVFKALVQFCLLSSSLRYPRTQTPLSAVHKGTVHPPPHVQLHGHETVKSVIGQSMAQGWGRGLNVVELRLGTLSILFGTT